MGALYKLCIKGRRIGAGVSRDPIDRFLRGWLGSMDAQRQQPGLVLVAPPGSNLVLATDGTLCRTPEPKPRLGGPSVDVFLTSVAAHLGPRAIAVVLSGMMHDGAPGISAVRRRGGATMAQHPASAVCDGKPSAAVDLGRADLMMSLPTLSQALLILIDGRRLTQPGVR